MVSTFCKELFEKSFQVLSFTKKKNYMVLYHNPGTDFSQSSNLISYIINNQRHCICKNATVFHSQWLKSYEQISLIDNLHLYPDSFVIIAWCFTYLWYYSVVLQMVSAETIFRSYMYIQYWPCTLKVSFSRNITSCDILSNQISCHIKTINNYGYYQINGIIM